MSFIPEHDRYEMGSGYTVDDSESDRTMQTESLKNLIGNGYVV